MSFNEIQIEARKAIDMEEWVILCDFDGTITERDVSEEILKELAEGDWRSIEQKADAGEISMDECIVSQFEMLPADLQKWIEIAERVSVREGFDSFIRKARSRRIDFTCVSAGLLPIIELYKSTRGWNFEVIAPEIRFKPEGVRVQTVPYSRKYKDFKEHHVREKQEEGKKILYIGDGGSDLNGIVHANLRCVVRGSSLEKILKERRLKFVPFTDFHEILELLDLNSK